jgi:hypothetical protein
MTNMILPTVGSSGYFELRTPFDQVILPNERYTCQAIRKLSDYLANNEDPKVEIYDANTISEAEYDQDVQDDMYIVSLQGETGQWVYVPARYVVKYPIVNGIPYRSMMVGVSLPPLPADKDLSYLSTDITNLIKDSLGVDVQIDLMETSMVILVDKARHDLEQAQRDALANGRTTDRSRYVSTQAQLDEALFKIQQLEGYIVANHIQTP